MNHSLRLLKWTVGIFVLTAALTGCAGGPSLSGGFYVLSALPESSTKKLAPTGGGHVIVGVGPVQLPAYLDRTQIVTLASPNRLDLNERDQWAEPLKDGFVSVLARNLSILLATDRVFRFPWRSPITVHYQVTVEVVQFDTDAAGRSTLSVRWNIIRLDNNRKLLHAQTSTFVSQRQGQGVEPIVAAMSENLGRLSREMSIRIASFRDK